MLNIQNLSIKDLRDHTLIDQLNMTLNPFDKIGIIGEEGNGKSTLLKAIVNRNEIEAYTSVSGTIDYGTDIIAYFEQQLNPKWEKQDITSYLLKENPHDDIEAYKYGELYELGQAAIRFHIPLKLMESSQLMETLSGGEKVKIRLLKIMHRQPDLLLLDEPTNDLDLTTLRWLEKFLKELNIPCLFISHDTHLLKACANGILHLEQLNKKSKVQHTFFRGTYQEYIEQRQQKREKQIQVSRKEKEEYRKKKEKLNDIMNAVHAVQNSISRRQPFYAAAIKNKMHSVKAMEKRMDQKGYQRVDSIEEAIDVFFEPVSIPARKMILEYHVNWLKVNERLLVRDIELQVYGNDKVQIIGDNGCGKSILMKQLYEELKDRDDITLGYMPQTYMDAFTGYPNAVEFLKESGDHEDITKCRNLLGAMKFTEAEMLQPIRLLSEGQKAKLLILSFIRRKCNVLLLDEPTRNLSPLSGEVLIKLLEAFDGCMISISHDRNYIKRCGKRIYEIKDQRWIKHQSVELVEGDDQDDG